MFGEQYRSLSSTSYSFLQSHVTSSLLGPNILLNTLFSNTLKLWHQVSHPYKATGKNICESNWEYMCTPRFANFSQIRRNMHKIRIYSGADKSLARPGWKQANVSVRMASISLGALSCRKKNLMTARAPRFCWNRARPWYASELVSFVAGLKTYQHPGNIIYVLQYNTTATELFLFNKRRNWTERADLISQILKKSVKQYGDYM